MRSRWPQLLCAVLALLSVVCVCPLSQAVPGRSMTAESRDIVLDDLKAFADSQPGVDAQAEKRALLDRLRSRPELTGSGIAVDGSVWGRFADGVWLLFPATKTPPDGSALQQRSLPAAASATARKVSALAIADARQARSPLRGAAADGGAPAIPESKEAMLLTALDPARWGGEENTLKAMLDHNGYHTISDEMTVEWLKAVRGVGVLYIDGHGGLGGDWSLTDEGPGKADPGDYIYAIGTSTPYAGDSGYAEDLQLGRLAILYNEEDEEYRLGFTGAFVAHYMLLSKGSFVYLGVCSGFNIDMQEGFRQAGASVIAAWTYPVQAADDARAVKTVFDLLLGDGMVVNDVTPLNRPFEYPKVWQYLAQHNLDRSETKPDSYPDEDWAGQTPEPTEEGSQTAISTLRCTPLNPGFRLLAPSIETMDVILEAQRETLVLHGVFGEDPGKENRKITIGGRAADPSQWVSAEEIHTPLPDADKEGGSGDVVIEIYDHKSNAVPLTLWHGELRYEVENLMGLLPGVGGLEQVVKFDAYIRADVHSYRKEPSLPPIPREEVGYAFSEPSKATSSFEGGEDFGCTISVSGEGEMRLWQLGLGEEPEAWFNGWGVINAKDHSMTLDGGMTLPEVGVIVITCPPPVPPTTINDYTGVVLDVMNETQTLTLADDWSIQMGSRTSNTAAGFPMPMDATLEWDAIPAKFVPTEDTKG